MKTSNTRHGVAALFSAAVISCLPVLGGCVVRPRRRTVVVRPRRRVVVVRPRRTVVVRPRRRVVVVKPAAPAVVVRPGAPAVVVRPAPAAAPDAVRTVAGCRARIARPAKRARCVHCIEVGGVFHKRGAATGFCRR